MNEIQNISQQIAINLRQVHFGGNWTASNLKDIVSDLKWEQVKTKIEGFNTIASLVFHVTYYVHAQLEVLDGKELNAKDELSFDLPSIKNQEDWEAYLDKSWLAAENLAQKIEQLPVTIWKEDFTDKKYGNYYRNIAGTIEHMNYHLGQIVFLKKMLKL